MCNGEFININKDKKYVLYEIEQSSQTVDFDFNISYEKEKELKIIAITISLDSSMYTYDLEAIINNRKTHANYAQLMCLFLPQSDISENYVSGYSYHHICKYRTYVDYDVLN